MSWTVNQPGNSSWTNNSTDATIGVTSYKVGSSSVQGYRINDEKKLFFGNDSDFYLRFSPSKNIFTITNANPITGAVTNILEYNTSTDTTKIRNLTLDAMILEEVLSNGLGIPTENATSGKVVYTTTSANVGKFYIGID